MLADDRLSRFDRLDARTAKAGDLVRIRGVAALSTAILLFRRSSADQLATAVGGQLTIFSELATSLLIGGTTAGMLLGHWYLTAPTMSITPLGQVNACFELGGRFAADRLARRPGSGLAELDGGNTRVVAGPAAGRRASAGPWSSP